MNINQTNNNNNNNIDNGEQNSINFVQNIKKIHIFYATQTGQSESIAKLIYEKLKNEIDELKNFKNSLNNEIDSFVKLNCISDYDKFINDFWLLNDNNNNNNNNESKNLLIIVASTTGQGDPPDKATKFFRWLRRMNRENNNRQQSKQQQQQQQQQQEKAKINKFEHITFALLGLGDTNYDNFCNFSKQLNKLFLELGAEKFLEPAFADDAIGLELITEPFIERLIAILVKNFEQSNCKNRKNTLSLFESSSLSLNEVVNEETELQQQQSDDITIDNNNNNKINDKNNDISSTPPSSSVTTIKSINDHCLSVSSESRSISEKSIAKQRNNYSIKNINKDNKISDKMNINRPVVSSCVALTSSDKCNLSDICRQLIESSAQLNIDSNNIEQLILPKSLSKKSSSKYHQFIYNQKNIEQFPFDDHDDNKYSNQIISMYDYLQNKIKNIGSSLNVGQVNLAKILSYDNDVCCHRQKTLLECDVEYDLLDNQNNDNDDDCQFIPGDSYGFYSSNLLIDVYQVIRSIKVKCFDHDNDSNNSNNNGNEGIDDESILLWDYFKGNKKQVYIVLNDNQNTIVELLPYLFYGVDLRTIPKKLTLYEFSKYTDDDQQRQRLMELSSKQGNDEYRKLILEQNITVCDILRLFDTCHPPIDVFLAHLLISKPRYFSVLSMDTNNHNNNVNDTSHNNDNDSNNNNDNNVQNVNKQLSDLSINQKCRFKIMFSVSTNFTHTFMRTSENLLGLFSGKFFSHYDFLPKNNHTNLKCTNVWKHIESIHENVLNGNIFDNQDVHLSTTTAFPVYLFKKLNKTFRLMPKELALKKPLILISTGTGIVPFLAYLNQLRKFRMEKQELFDKFQDIFFIFGCRNPYQDFVYSNQLISYSKQSSSSSLKTIINHLCLCFSRANHSDLIKFESETNIKLCYSNINNYKNCYNHNNDPTTNNHVNCDIETNDDTKKHPEANNYDDNECFNECTKQQQFESSKQKPENSCDTNSNDTNFISYNNNIKKHVDHLIRIHGKELVELIINHNANIYICGNWRIITADIKKAFQEIFIKYYFNDQLLLQQNNNNDHNVNNNNNNTNDNNVNKQIVNLEKKAIEYMKHLQKNGRFLQDIWT